jgi:dTDP-4-dehydrorhamnose reductase
MRYLVIGVDGLIGAKLFARLEKMGASVVGTTRRLGPPSLPNRVLLDLADENVVNFYVGDFSVAFFCASITSMSACEDAPESTRKVNVLNTISIARRLLAQGTRIVYLSSNTVFSGKDPWPDEFTACAPVNEYGRQKAEVEMALLGLSSWSAKLSIVRLSKVLSGYAGIAANFIRRLANGEPCLAFNDLLMSPISLEYAVEGLLAVSLSEEFGIFHLSGEKEIVYADLAFELATSLGLDPLLVQPVSSVFANTRVLFRPAHPGLGMQRTRELLGIEPEPFEHLMNALVLINAHDLAKKN